MVMYGPIAYAYQADNYCLDCTREMFFDASTMEATDDVETVLDKAAKARGIADRYDERSYDSADFPKHCAYNDDDTRQSSCGRCFQRIEDTL